LPGITGSAISGVGNDASALPNQDLPKKSSQPESLNSVDSWPTPGYSHNRKLAHSLDFEMPEMHGLDVVK